MPPTERVSQDGLVRALRGKGDAPSLLARRYRSHGHRDELSQAERKVPGARSHPQLPSAGRLWRGFSLGGCHRNLIGPWFAADTGWSRVARLRCARLWSCGRADGTLGPAGSSASARSADVLGGACFDSWRYGSA
jgi:hypothetical protein